MTFTCAILNIKSASDREILYHLPFDIPKITSAQLQSSKIIPTVISRAIEEVNKSDIPEQLDAIIDKSRIRFSVTGPGINVEFDLKGKNLS